MQAVRRTYPNYRESQGRGTLPLPPLFPEITDPPLSDPGSKVRNSALFDVFAALWCGDILVCLEDVLVLSDAPNCMRAIYFKFSNRLRTRRTEAH